MSWVGDRARRCGRALGARRRDVGGATEIVDAIPHDRLHDVRLVRVQPAHCVPSFGPCERAADVPNPNHAESLTSSGRGGAGRVQHGTPPFTMKRGRRSTWRWRLVFRIETLLRNETDRKSTRLNSSHLVISYAVFCLKKKK